MPRESILEPDYQPVVEERPYLEETAPVTAYQEEVVAAADPVYQPESEAVYQPEAVYQAELEREEVALVQEEIAVA